MDVMNLYKMVIDELIYIWSIKMTIGGYTVTIGAVVVFALFASVIIGFIRGLAS
jgi:hypothetical protein